MRSMRQGTGYQDGDRREPFSVNRVQLDPVAQDTARALPSAPGRPLHTAILELEALDERFVCERCDDE